MAYTLFIGDYAYSSWSLRGWLLFRRFGIETKIRNVELRADGLGAQLSEIAPARTVPSAVADGTVIWDSLALAEELASRHPEAGIWPSDPGMRATARSLAAEMHSGFPALRSECPMNLRLAYVGFAPSPEVQSELARAQTIWSYALTRSGGPWLCGDYSAADAFFAPLAARIATYGLPVSETAQAYVMQHLHDPAFRRWRAMGFAKGADMPWNAKDNAKTPWPGPTPLPAQPIHDGTAENDFCPYSGDPVTHLMQVESRVFGMCNAFCRDKTVADPEAWPQFMALLNG